MKFWNVAEEHREISWSDLPQKAHSGALEMEGRTQGNLGRRARVGIIKILRLRSLA